MFEQTQALMAAETGIIIAMAMMLFGAVIVRDSRVHLILVAAATVATFGLHMVSPYNLTARYYLAAIIIVSTCKAVYSLWQEHRNTAV